MMGPRRVVTRSMLSHRMARNASGYSAATDCRMTTSSTPIPSSARARRSAYHARIREVYSSLVLPGSRVLDIGCGDGSLLASLAPSRGLGIDIDAAAIADAAAANPGLEFRRLDAHEPLPEGPWDFVILSHVLGEFHDIQAVLRRVRAACGPSTRIIVNTCSRLWTIPLRIAESTGIGKPKFERAWLSPMDLRNLLQIEGFQVVCTRAEILCPLPIPLVAPLLNRYAAKLPLFELLDLGHFCIARAAPTESAAEAAARPPASLPSATVVIPLRNEMGHVRSIFERLPAIGSSTEYIFVEGNSTDDTWGELNRVASEYAHLRPVLLKQAGKGKGDAVRLGFSRATKDVLMILDADLTVPPESLPRFMDVIASGQGEFVNGARLVYPMQTEAMRFLNLVFNKAFAVLFSWVLEQPVKDTLCGTKVLSRTSYEVLAANRSFFGDFDPFGDFDLLFGASRMHLRITDLPVRYGARSYGETNIQRWRHGVLLLRMLVVAARKLKFR